MKVSLINYTGIGTQDPARFAANQLIFTKSTRLEMRPSLMTDIEAMDYKKVLIELEYMANTIPSSWEFVDYTWLVEDVTRAYTHQQVRTRQASYAQQTMRVLNVEGWKYATGPTIPQKDTPGDLNYDEQQRQKLYHFEMEKIAEVYKELIAHGASIEDARGILPTNILTNIVVKMNMRNFVEMIRKRSSSRTQGEYRSVIDTMQAETKRVHPWISMFLERTFDRAISDLEKKILSQVANATERVSMIKLLDQLRATQ